MPESITAQKISASLLGRLTSLSNRDILTVIEYLENYLKMKKIEKKISDES